MNITSERVGGTILLTAEDCKRQITIVISLAQATKLGTVLLAQACLDDDGLELPEALRLKEPEA
jgi:hypothetical protein